MFEAIGAWMAELPLVALWLFLFAGAALRGNAIYWIGRGISEGGRRSRFGNAFTGPRMAGAEEFVAKWGALAIPLGYLTVGFQSMVLAVTGITRMPMWRFQPAVAVGSALWATIYTTIGFAAWETVIGLAARSPWAIAVVTVLAVIITVKVVRRRAARRAGRTDEQRCDSVQR